MKTFDLGDIVYFKDKRFVKNGDLGYFTDNEYMMFYEVNYTERLINKIVGFNEETQKFKTESGEYSLFLPLEKVRVHSPTLRPCETVQEVLNVLNGNYIDKTLDLSMTKEEAISRLNGRIIHWIIDSIEEDVSIVEVHTNVGDFITGEKKNYGVSDQGYIYLTFENYADYTEQLINARIKVNGSWIPFGILETR